MTTPPRRRLSRILDTSAILALFDAHPAVARLLAAADRHLVDVYLPAVCVAEAETLLHAGANGWSAAVRLGGGVHEMPLSVSAAVDIGGCPGPLGARHAAWEARHLSGVVVTQRPGWYEGHLVDLRVI